LAPSTSGSLNIFFSFSSDSCCHQVRFDAVDRGGVLPYSGHSCYRCVASMASSALSTTATATSSSSTPMDFTETSADSSSAWLAFQKTATMNDASFAHSQVYRGGGGGELLNKRGWGLGIKGRNR